MRRDQEFLLTMSNKLDAQETLIEAQQRQIQDMTAMSKTHYAVPKAVTEEEARAWWLKNRDRFYLGYSRGRAIAAALTEFCNERAEAKPWKFKFTPYESPDDPWDGKVLPRYKRPTIECQLCFEDEGSYACIRPSHWRNRQNNDIEGVPV